MTNLITLLCLLTAAHANRSHVHRAPAQETWRPIGYETLRLPKPIPEGVTFSRARNEADRTAYEVVYFLGERAVRKSGLPAELYRGLKQKLQTSVFDLAKKNIGQPCPNHITWESGTFNPNKSVTIDYCLGHGASEAFAAWYKSLMQILFQVGR